VRKVGQDAQSAWVLTSDKERLTADIVIGADGHRSTIPNATYLELAAQARELFPSPWKDAILDSIERRPVIGTPIAEYVPARLANGRAAIAGDAAHVPTP